MRYRLLGRSGLRVSEMCLGTMTFGENWGWGAPKEECRQIFDSFVNAGGNFIDTASNYTDGASEHIVGELISSDRDRFVLATKYSLNPMPVVGRSGNSRKNMLQSVETSLRRLKTDRIDLLWLHAWDYTTPVEEVMRGLDDLVAAGKVNYIGFSDTPAWIVSRAQTLAEMRGWSQIIGLQLEYNLIERGIERELMPAAQGYGMEILAWSPLAGGVLSGKYNRKTSREVGRYENESAKRFFTIDERSLKIAAKVLEIAEDIRKTPSQVALNWVRQHSGIIPILGVKRLSQLEDNLACLNWQLERDQLQALEEASKIDLGFPYQFLQSAPVRELLVGEGMDRFLDKRIA